MLQLSFIACGLLMALCVILVGINGRRQVDIINLQADKDELIAENEVLTDLLDAERNKYRSPDADPFRSSCPLHSNGISQL